MPISTEPSKYSTYRQSVKFCCEMIQMHFCIIEQTSPYFFVKFCPMYTLMTNISSYAAYQAAVIKTKGLSLRALAEWIHCQ